MKIIIATGSLDINKKINLAAHIIVDSVNDLSELIDLLNYVSVDILIVNRLLDSEAGDKLIELAKTAQEKNIKIIMLTDKVDDYQERKLISVLSNLSVYSFITFADINEKTINNTINSYPKQFEFSILAETIVKEKPVTVTQERIVERIINYHNKVITIVGNAELTAELAVVAAKYCNKKVCVMDLDFWDSGLDLLLNIESDIRDSSYTSIYQYMTENIENTALDKNIVEQSSIKLKGLNIHTLLEEYKHSNYQDYKSIAINQLIDLIYRNYDLTVINANSSVLDEYSIIAVRNSDNVIISLNGDRISRRQSENYALYMHNTFRIPLDRFSYIVFDYDESKDAPKGYFKENIPEEQLLGFIRFNNKRHSNRNSKVIYARKIQGSHLNEYLEILQKFNISSNFNNKYYTSISEMKNHYTKIFRVTKRNLLRR